MEENQGKRQNIEVTILSVDKDNGTVEVENGDGEIGIFPVVAPAKITYAKEGKATIGFNGSGISYIHSEEPKKQGNSFYPKRSYPPKQNYSNGFKSFNQKNEIKPVPSNEYKEEVESKRIGLTKVVRSTSLEDISVIYNTLSLGGKWIVATNIFQKGDMYDAIFFISEKRDTLNKQEYYIPLIKDKPTEQIETETDYPTKIKEDSVGYM